MGSEALLEVLRPVRGADGAQKRRKNLNKNEKLMVEAAGIEPVANLLNYLKLLMFHRFRMFLQCSSSSDLSPSRNG